ncbi:zinc finger protein 429-like [Centruroides sculpturatus]|uniref:zinc finger protein 429-like n=1 Tax=Centruroides sculpturatus TaxID=218467 RepID=UPI000C6EB6DD|nr:zinc finger protein 429-like [Centruroides sculpturatus]
MNSEKDEKEKHECPECGRSFKKNFMLKRHIRRHTDERPYVCEICGGRFSFSSTLKRHNKVVHSKERGYKRNYQNCTFNTKYKNNFFNQLHGEHVQAVSSRIPSIETKGIIYECDIFKKIILHKWILNCHKKWKHPQATESYSKKSTEHGQEVQADYFQTPSTSAQARGSNESEQMALKEIIFTPGEAKEFLKYFNVYLEIKKLETSQLEFYSKIVETVETIEIKFECQLCGQQFPFEI